MLKRAGHTRPGMSSTPPIFTLRDHIRQHGMVIFLISNLLLVLMVGFGAMLLVGSVSSAREGVSPALVGLLALFGLFIGGVGLHRIYFLYFRLLAVQWREAEIMRRYPGQPWMLNPIWARGTIVDRTIGQVIFLWIFLVGWFSGIAFVVSEKQVAIEQAFADHPLKSAAFSFFFGLITLMAIGLTVRTTLSWLRIGDGILTLDTLPGVTGRRFAAKFRTRSPRRLMMPLTIELRCMRHDAGLRKPGGRDTRRTMPSLLYSDDIALRPEEWTAGAKGDFAALSFDLPAGVPASDPKTGIVWTLRLSSNSPTGVLVLFNFAVPVYRAGSRKRPKG